jgi:hypothetical protein
MLLKGHPAPGSAIETFMVRPSRLAALEARAGDHLPQLILALCVSTKPYGRWASIPATQQVFATELGISIRALQKYEQEQVPEPRALVP